jgi:hypothetical protein
MVKITRIELELEADVILIAQKDPQASSASWERPAG